MLNEKFSIAQHMVWIAFAQFSYYYVTSKNNIRYNYRVYKSNISFIKIVNLTIKN